MENEILHLADNGLKLDLAGFVRQGQREDSNLFLPVGRIWAGAVVLLHCPPILVCRPGMWLAPEGTSIAAMYPYWLLGLLLLFPVCLMYGRLKHRPPVNTVLRYLQLGFRQGDNKNEVGTLCGILWNSYLSNI